MFAGGASIVFVDILDPMVWFSYVVGFALAGLSVLAVERRSHSLPFSARFVAAIAAVAVSLLVVPDVLIDLPYALIGWATIVYTVGGVVAAALARYVYRTRGRRKAIAAAAGVLLAVAGAALAGPLVGIDPLPASIVAAVSLVPVCSYAGIAAFDRPETRAGLVFAAVVVGGAFLGAAVADLAGFAGPTSWVNWSFLTNAHSGTAAEAGLYPAIGGSILLMVTVAALSFPLGVGAAVYLEEYAPDNRFTRFIDINISNLAGVPSVVYGLLGLGVFVTYAGRAMGTVLVGGATLSLLILPIVIISSREAIRSVPEEMRQASYGMGATRWQTVKNVVLPRAFPGIMTGTILALGRAIGETAPLIMIGAPNVAFSLPTELTSKVSAMPLQVYAWAGLFASEEFYQQAVPAGVVVLLVVLLSMNSVAIVLRNRYEDGN
jgi:phosphate transport system permease protein